MSRTYKYARNSVYILTIFSFLAFSLMGVFNQNETQAKGKNTASSIGGTTFPGTGVGPIPDGQCGTSDLVVSFEVSGITGTPSNMDMDITFGPIHTWAGDVDMVLASPDGTEHVIQSFTGGNVPTGFGDSSDLEGPYTFSDTATANWWAAAAAAGAGDAIPSGSYRTQAAGPDATDDPGPAFTSIMDAFTNIPDWNGTWTLTVGDCANQDPGEVSAANLIISSGTSTSSSKPNVDMDGDGKTDFVVGRDESNNLSINGKSNNPIFRAKTGRERMKLAYERYKNGKNKDIVSNLGGNAGTSLVWYVYNSGNDSFNVTGHGDGQTDFGVPADYDGDGKDDIAVWRPVTSGQASGNGFFYILNSSDSTMSEMDFGQSFDVPAVTGDYDGDEKADPAVFRCGFSDEQCVFFYKGSAGGGEITFVPWGFGNAFSIFPYPGDFDGDGKFDFCIQREDPENDNQGQFVILRSSDFGVTYVNFGLNTDSLAPGDYNGNGKTDFAVVRTEGQNNQLVWYVLSDDGTILYPGTPFGLFDEDFITPGDYDGDGKADLSVWRSDPNNEDNNFFYSLNSSNQSVSTFEWGIFNDYPLANWRVQ